MGASGGPAPRLVVIGASSRPVAASTLDDLGATAWWSRPVAAGVDLQYAAFASEDAVRAAVRALRAAGISAMDRPTDDDPALFGWRNRTRPIPVAQGRLRVCFPWSEEDRDPNTEVVIDPGAAFGGGSHPTTQLVLDALGQHLVGGERVLDVGCGSGVLAIAAVRLDASSAVAVDIDPAAIVATRANAERNGVASRVSALAIPIQELPDCFDVIVANIGSEVLIDLAPDLVRLLRPGGWVAVSGISPAQTEWVARAFRPLTILATNNVDDWSGLVLR